MFVQQRQDHDCAVASLSMLLDSSYEETYAGLSAMGVPVFEKAVNQDQIFRYLKRAGLTPLLTDALPPVPSLVSVPALNFKGAMHMVYWDGQELFDPQMGRKDPGIEYYTTGYFYSRRSFGQVITTKEFLKDVSERVEICEGCQFARVKR